MAKKGYWLKLHYRDWLSDEKIRMLDLDAIGLWLKLLCQAACSPVQGRLLITRQRRPTDDELARILGVESVKLREILDGTLLPLGLISQTQGGVLYFRHWHKYQRSRGLQQDRVGAKTDSRLEQKPNSVGAQDIDKDKEREKEKEKEEACTPRKKKALRGKPAATRKRKRKVNTTALKQAAQQLHDWWSEAARKGYVKRVVSPHLWGRHRWTLLRFHLEEHPKEYMDLAFRAITQIVSGSCKFIVEQWHPGFDKVLTMKFIRSILEGDYDDFYKQVRERDDTDEGPIDWREVERLAADSQARRERKT